MGFGPLLSISCQLLPVLQSAHSKYSVLSSEALLIVCASICSINSSLKNKTNKQNSLSEAFADFQAANTPCVAHFKVLCDITRLEKKCIINSMSFVISPPDTILYLCSDTIDTNNLKCIDNIVNCKKKLLGSDKC